ncbi:hypothetical protein NC661_03995 [Aquibacillus koreensis]|uniref:DUF3397 domain-containing protein n=1 Tax=Aquibacillus koreensis TaxID=279446 RepID=A0A9X3WJ32_9BACI|nr:hypothetical protein [Aquibacillus koreensis]MCT2534866.1 hypothetical protein [Aquibacillus koreensis]MDC3419523.1 hypothetical protein [Aquibacillus koreensis]
MNTLFIIHFLIAIALFYLLTSWSRGLKKRYKAYLYFLISASIVPIYSEATEEGDFHLWFPLGFIFLMLYLIICLRKNVKYPAAIWKATLLGFGVSVYLSLLAYGVIIL